MRGYLFVTGLRQTNADDQDTRDTSSVNGNDDSPDGEDGHVADKYGGDSGDEGNSSDDDAIKAALLKDVREMTRKWWLESPLGKYLTDANGMKEDRGHNNAEAGARAGAGASAEELERWHGFARWAPVAAIGNGNEGNSTGGTGIPFHGHNAAWLHLIQGTKLWHFYPPDRTPPVEAVDSEGGVTGHPSWITNLLPTLEDAEKPLEYLQHAGETVYVPEGWWHATQNIAGEEASAGQVRGAGVDGRAASASTVVVAVGGQARTPDSNGIARVKSEVSSLVENGDDAAAAEMMRAARAAHAAAGKVHGGAMLAYLHGQCSRNTDETSFPDTHPDTHTHTHTHRHPDTHTHTHTQTHTLLPSVQSIPQFNY